MAENNEQTTLAQIADHALQLARRAGAQSADVLVERAREFEVKVADGRIVTLTQATRVELGLRAFVNGRRGFCAATDLTPEGLERGIATAVAMAKITGEDPHHGLTAPVGSPTPGAQVRAQAELDTFDPAVEAWSEADKLRFAHDVEAAARSAHAEVQTFRDSGVSTEVAEQYFAASDGRSHAHRQTGAAAWCTPVARRGNELQTDFWYDSQCHLSELASAESIGAAAAARAGRMLGARAVATQKVPVIFEAAAAAGLLGSMLAALDGDLVHRRASFLAPYLDRQLASTLLHLTDEPHLPRGLRSRLMDGEGLWTSPRALLDCGRLATFLYDGYSARRASATPTASAQRSAGGLPGAGVFNAVVRPGNTPLAKLLAETPRALLVTRGLGRGLNPVSGEYSRGVSGLWLEHGEVVHPVQEVTVAGEFAAMLAAIDGVADDAVCRGAVTSPTLRVAEMAVGGS